MSGLLSVLGLLGVLVALVGLCRGSLRTVGLTTRGQCAQAAVAAFALLVLGGALAPDREPPRDIVTGVAAATAAEATAAPSPSTATPAASPSAEAAVAQRAEPTAPSSHPAPPRTAAALPPLLQMASGGDGDSWRDTDGVEYRMGLINTPETDECGGSAATSYRRQALAEGFRATTYETDRYGRRVSVITAPNGVNLNVAMARDGIADDSYLEQFRHENPSLAAQLDGAFAEARAAGRGIWTSCAAPAAEAAAPAPAPQPVAAGGCHPDYETCIPVKGDGSGRGAANDLDCGDLAAAVRLRQIGVDPYRLDGRDQDGIGCE